MHGIIHGRAKWMFQWHSLLQITFVRLSIHEQHISFVQPFILIQCMQCYAMNNMKSLTNSWSFNLQQSVKIDQSIVATPKCSIRKSNSNKLKLASVVQRVYVRVTFHG